MLIGRLRRKRLHIAQATREPSYSRGFRLSNAGVFAVCTYAAANSIDPEWMNVLAGRVRRRELNTHPTGSRCKKLRRTACELVHHAKLNFSSLSDILHSHCENFIC